MLRGYFSYDRASSKVREIHPPRELFVAEPPFLQPDYGAPSFPEMNSGNERIV